jgi:uncharacterized protein (TIGR03437 family)
MKHNILNTSKIVVCLFGISILPASQAFAQPLIVLNAASQQNVHIAPGSIVTIFGTNLAAGTAVTPSALNPPTTLGGVTLTIGGVSAILFFTSPGQINAVVSPATPTGTQTVIVNSTTGTQQGSVLIDTNSPPGLFALNGHGTGDGAFVNALTALLGPFTPGSTTTTFLELFTTGMNLAFTPTGTIGGVPATVVFAGASPCCAGLQQINIIVPLALAGAGRVPVVVTDNGQASNAVEVVLLPPPANKQFVNDRDDERRNRELAELAYVPGTSLVLSTDENDDVVRVVDISARRITQVIALSVGAGPGSITVNAAGTLAIVTERNLGKVAIINLATFTVIAEVSTGTLSAPVSAAIAGSQAVIVNRDTSSVSIIDLSSNTVTKSIPVGNSPRGVAVDTTANKAYVTNENDGTISVIDLAGLTVTSTITVNTNARLEEIAILAGTGVAFVTAPASSQIFLVTLATGVATPITATPAGSAGSTDVVVFNGKIYFANQAGGSVSVLPIDPVTGAATGAITSIKVDLGARSLVVDTKDNLLVVSNEGTGTLVLINLSTGTIVDRINAVRSNNSGDTGDDDNSDHDNAANVPSIGSVLPASGRAGTSFTITIVGSRLTGASDIVFTTQSKGHDKGGNGDSDNAFSAKSIVVSAGGTQVTATISIAASAGTGPRSVAVVTPNGRSRTDSSTATTFTVTP